MTFEPFGLDGRLIRAIGEMEFREPTRIQELAIPRIREGRDVLGQAMTGTGKTAAFGLPILHALLQRGARKRVGALVIEPTRELAAQAHRHLCALAKHTDLKGVAVTGGEGDHAVQENALRQGTDWVVGTPGRLLDMAMRGAMDLLALEFLVLDEADRLLEMGFVDDVRRIASFARERRTTLLFSATLPREMRDLARAILDDPVRIEAELATTPEPVEEVVWPVPNRQKIALLRALLRQRDVGSALIFVRTREKADRLAETLAKAGLNAQALHGDRPMTERRAALEAFRRGETRYLVATDLASRGLDISGVSHVVNYDMPGTPEDYIHRAGRTGRMGRTGAAWTFMAKGDLVHIARVEVLIGKRLKVERLEGFEYREDRGDVPSPKRGAAHGSLSSRKGSAEKKESPFTKSGNVRKKFSVEDPAREMQKKRKKRVRLKKKLPHEK